MLWLLVVSCVCLWLGVFAWPGEPFQTFSILTTICKLLPVIQCISRGRFQAILANPWPGECFAHTAWHVSKSFTLKHPRDASRRGSYSAGMWASDRWRREGRCAEGTFQFRDSLICCGLPRCCPIGLMKSCPGSVGGMPGTSVFRI